MRAFVIKEGTKAHAVKFDGLKNPVIDEKTIKKEVTYFLEDIVIDPVGKVECGPQYNTIQYNRRTMGKERSLILR